MTSYHTIINNLNANKWAYNEDLGIWTNKNGYNIEHTGKIIHNGKEIYFPIARETNDDLEGRALRFEYTGNGNSSKVVSNSWCSYNDQYFLRQNKLSKKRRQKARLRRKNCEENEYQLEKDYERNKKEYEKNNEEYENKKE